jgi:hypothetical protein
MHLAIVFTTFFAVLLLLIAVYEAYQFVFNLRYKNEKVEDAGYRGKP